MLIIFLKESNQFFTSLKAYVMLSFFFIVNGLVWFIFPQTNLFDQQYANLNIFFNWEPYLFMILVSAITMGIFIEENQNHTLEKLLISPLRIYQIILGKYFFCMSIMALHLLLTLSYAFTIYHFALPKGSLDLHSLFSGYLALFLLLSIFIAIGMYVSSFSNSQIIAFLITLFICCILYTGIEALVSLYPFLNIFFVFLYTSLGYHYHQIQHGVLYSTSLVYFCYLLILLLSLTKFSLSNNR